MKFRLVTRRNKVLSNSENYANIPAVYEAESPDELALVFAARKYGLKLVRKTIENMTLVTPDHNLLRIGLLKVLGFDSKRFVIFYTSYNLYAFDELKIICLRKKMSVIVRVNDEIVLYCKGADFEIFNSLSPLFTQSEYGAEIVQKTKQHLEKFSNAGLRTLCLAKRTLSYSEYESWLLKHAEVFYICLTRHTYNFTFLIYNY